METITFAAPILLRSLSEVRTIFAISSGSLRRSSSGIFHPFSTALSIIRVSRVPSVNDVPSIASAISDRFRFQFRCGDSLGFYPSTFQNKALPLDSRRHISHAFRS